MQMPESPTLTPEQAQSLYHGVEDRDARAFLDFLIDHPDEQHNSEYLQQELAFAEHKHVALAAYAIGEVAGSLGLVRPWTEGQKGYAMPAQNSILLALARANTGGTNQGE
jgi:hypothetical protein